MKNMKNIKDQKINQVKELILFIIGQVDYDIYKGFLPQTAEEPEYAEEQLNKLIKKVCSNFKGLLIK